MQLKQQKEEQTKSNQDKFTQVVKEANYPIDLLTEYLPEAIEGMCKDQSLCLTGCYVGELTYRHKSLEEHNFEPGA